MHKEHSMEDIFVWPDAVWCYRYESHEYMCFGDDYEVIYCGTLAYANFFDMLKLCE